MKWLAVALWGIIIGGLLGMREAPPVVAQEEAAAPAVVSIPFGRKSVVTADMFISAGFYATGSPYWNGGIHSGVDYAAAEGSPVYMPFDCQFLMVGFYADAGRYGEYLMCHFADGSEYYTGHLQGVRSFAPGEIIVAGSQIGWTNELAHTHVQLRDTSGALVDFAQYYQEH